MTFSFWGLRRRGDAYLPYVALQLDFKNGLAWWRNG
jgi:hypothetical protein